jgi:regulator of PEP synthase PpsR (kinase-PPPase family)
VGDLLLHLAKVLGQSPVEKPGLYRQLNQDYFERVSAIDFTMTHDDGKNPQNWSKAEIVLTGVSRVGKTPLSMYLAVLGWKVANVPLVMGLPPPTELFQLDRHRVIGLTIDPSKLLSHRRQRQKRLGTARTSPYSNPVKLFEEVEAADKIFKRGGFSVLDVTDKPIEASAEDIVKLISRRTKGKSARSTNLP